MYVRLAFAVAAHLEPEILVVDEVLAVGDAAFQAKCVGKMGAVALQGRTVLFVSHNIPVVQRVCHRCLWMRKGRLAADGPTDCTVQAYIGGGGRQILAWQRQGAPPRPAHIHSVRLSDANGAPLETVSSSDTPVLEIECVVTDTVPDLQLAFALHDMQERPIFASSPQDVDVAYPNQRGMHLYRAAFPGPILMPQRYSITVSLYSRYGDVNDSVPHVLAFEVMETASPHHRGDYNRYGVLQLRCPWTHGVTPPS
jgi:lipopolysaccharide transport system ATP-binding protein